MNTNQWTRGLITAGVISLGAVAQAEETAISGYVSTTASWAPNVMQPAGASFMPGVDGFDLDNVDITISKPLDEGEWASGYAVELWVGPQAANLGNRIGGVVGANDSGNNFAIKQANVQLNAPVGNGLVLTMGVFDTIIGYETANIGDNPNVTRSHGFTTEPFQHLGLLASYQICESASLSVGVANENGTALNSRNTNPSAKTYMAAVTLIAPDSLGPLGGASITAGVVDGDYTAASIVNTVLPGPDATHIYVGGDIPTPIENLSLGVAWDHLNVDGFSDTDSIAAYIGYKVSDKLGINTRIDYQDQGLDIAGVGSPGGEYLGTTVTADYSLWANVVTRAEWRWDKDLDGDGFNRTASARNNNHMFLLNVIYNF
jgi:predicted porin